MDDPLADVLALLRPEVVLTAELCASGRWGLAFEGHPTDVKFGVVIEGECSLAIGGRAKRLHAGDVFLLGAPPAYVVASDLGAPRQSAREVLHRTKKRVVRLGTKGPVVRAIGGRFILDSANAHLLVEALPTFVRIPAEEAGALRGVTQLLVDEVRSAQLGRTRTLDQLTQLLLTYALRSSAVRTGWLQALADPQIGPAIRHIHTTLGASVADLAQVAGMSRTAFAARFKALVGKPPLAYAIQWRMSLAKDALRASSRRIGELAFSLGYESESAFSMSFKREIGCSPRDYRNGVTSRASSA